MMLREDQALIRVSIDRKPLFDNWATVSGGAVKVANAKTRTGGGGREVSLGGPGARDDLTVTIQLSDIVMARDAYIESTLGRKRMQISVTLLDGDFNPLPGTTKTRTGTPGSWELPNMDANAGQNTAFATLVMNCDELATTG